MRHFPVNSQAIISDFDVDSSGFQPRAYASGYQLPEKILSYTASLQQQLPWRNGPDRRLCRQPGTQSVPALLDQRHRRCYDKSRTGAGIAILGGPAFGQIDYKTSGGTDHYDSMQTSVQRRFAKGLTIGGQWTWSHRSAIPADRMKRRRAQNPFNFERIVATTPSTCGTART